MALIHADWGGRGSLTPLGIRDDAGGEAGIGSSGILSSVIPREAKRRGTHGKKPGGCPTDGCGPGSLAPLGIRDDARGERSR